MAVDVASIFALLPGLAKAGKDLSEASSAADRNAQLIEFQQIVIQLQSALASVQAENASLLGKIHDLDNEIVSMKDWDGEKQRYALVSLWQGVASAFAIKKSMGDGQPAHYLCPNCFNQSKKSYLNLLVSPRTAHGSTTALACAVCPTRLHYPYMGSPPAAEYAPE